MSDALNNTPVMYGYIWILILEAQFLRKTSQKGKETTIHY